MFVINSYRVIVMKQSTKEILAAVMLAVIVPAIVFRVLEKTMLNQPEKIEENVIPIESTQQATNALVIPVLCQDNSVRLVDMDTYITGVVLAEMPAEFELEALKAQAVVARTYALKRVLYGNKHKDHAVCTDPSCCQAYIAVTEYIAKDNGEACIAKASQAVRETATEILTYDGDLIDATYYSCSGGKTEDAVDVWGAEIPYLRAVVSPGEESAEHFTDTKQFGFEEFCSLLSVDSDVVKSEGIHVVAHTKGGGVKTLQVGGVLFSGVEVRRILRLRSTAFQVTQTGDSIIFTTKGYGHRVGMSQYGAEAMAVAGCSYVAILSHYYPGAVLEQWKQN